MSNNTEIPEEAVEDAAKAMFADEHCDKRQMTDVDGNWNSRLNDEDQALYRSMARAALAAALPHLRVQETPREITHLVTDGEGVTACCGRTPFELPRTGRITGFPDDAYGCPAPHPRPVVDREALALEVHKATCMTSPHSMCPGPQEVDYVRADAVLALLPEVVTQGGN